MIPQDKKITIIPNLLIKYINDTILDIKEDIDVDQDVIRKKYQLYTINKVYNRITYLFKNSSFWKNIMNTYYCDFKYKKGIKAGMFCGKSIDITCEDGKNYYKCSRHISKKYYKPIKKKDPVKLCIALNNTGGKCGSYKHYGDYCTYHKEHMFIDEMLLFCNIEYTTLNIIIPYIEIIDIKYNMEICLENNCFNKSALNEDLCQEDVDEQKSIYGDIQVKTSEKLSSTLNKNIANIEDFQFTFKFDYNKNKKIEGKVDYENNLSNELDCVLDNIDNTIKEIKEDNNNFIRKCNETINKNGSI